MDWKKKCIICDKKGGNVLVCKGDGCPISLHESCMDCEIRLSDAEKDNFHCPYCSYKQSISELCRAREKVMLTKQALSIFLEEEEQGPSSKEKLVDVNNPVPGDIQNTGVSLEKQQQQQQQSSKMPVPGSIGCEEDNMVKADQPGSGVNKKVQGGYQTRSATQKHATYIEEEEAPVQSKSKKQITGKKRNNSVAFNENETSKRTKLCMMEKTAETLVSLQNRSQLQSNPNDKIDPNGAIPGTKNISSSSNSGEQNKKIDQSDPASHPRKEGGSLETDINDPEDSSVDRSKVLPSELGKPSRVLWTKQEEDKLKEGVQKFTSAKRRNIPWKKILDFGSDVFNPCRNPADLKDKWRHMAKQTEEATTANLD